MREPIITSRQNPLVKYVCGLEDKRKRNDGGVFRFDGIKLLEEALDADVRLKYVICREGISDKAEELSQRAVERGAERVTVGAEAFEKMTSEKAPEGIITVAYMLGELHGAAGATGEFPCDGRLLIVEALRDTGNLGTVLRSAYALGIDTLVMSEDCADIYNPKTLRAAMGAAFKLRTVTVPSVPEYVLRLRECGRRVYAAALCENSRAISTLDIRDGDCFVIGNEGHGLEQATVEACTLPVIIPMRRGAESLNAAAAATICIWETVRAKK